MAEPIQSTVAVLVNRDHRVLIGERAGDVAFPGWCLPGGRIDPGETPEEAVLRELREETGLTGIVTGSLPDRIAHSRHEAYTIKVFTVQPHDWHAPITCSPEHREFRWVHHGLALKTLPLAGNATRSILQGLRFPVAGQQPVYWPLLGCQPMLPDAIGLFGAKRRYEHHSGIDLYCELGTRVLAIEDGEVIAIEDFTGPKSTPPSPWWNPTQAVLVRSRMKVLAYGEISAMVSVGQKVKGGEVLGVVDTPVLRHFKGRPTVMLHLEQLHSCAKASEVWPLTEKYPNYLLDPFHLLWEVAGKVDVPTFDLSKYDGLKYMDPNQPQRPSQWWQVWGGSPRPGDSDG